MHNNSYRYTLDKSSKKFYCPHCNKRKFVRYIDTETNEYLPNKYGRCDREINCPYHLNPYKDGYAKGNTTLTQIPFKKRVKPQLTFIPKTILKQTQKGYENNIFIQNLLHNIPYPFKVKSIESIIALYQLGTINKGFRKGATTFPFIDVNKQIRTIQVKQFDVNNHTTGTDFLHSMIDRYYKKNNTQQPLWLTAYLKNDLKVSCLFGEHLLNKYPNHSVALVEAPKTAIYATLYFGLPNIKNLIWLAVYNLSSLNGNKVKVLKGRNVILFPDLSKNGKAFTDWSNKAKQFEKQLPNTKFIVSNLLELNAKDNERNNGYDLADFLIKQDWRAYQK